MKTIRNMMFAVAVLALGMFAVPAAHAQLNSATTVAVTLNTQVNESLTISATPTSVSFNGQQGVVQANGGITVNTSWVLNSATRTKVTLYAYFTGVNALTGTNSTHLIQSSQVLGNIDGDAFTACNVQDPFTTFDCIGGGFLLASTNSPSSLWPIGSASHTLNLEINLGTSTPVDTYTGTLTLEAQAV